LWCRLVTYDEGLCSSKAIAFIAAKSNCNSVNLGTISYLVLGIFPQQSILSEQKTPRCFFERLGDNLWIK